MNTSLNPQVFGTLLAYINSSPRPETCNHITYGQFGMYYSRCTYN